MVDDKPLTQLLIIVSDEPNPTHWAEAYLTLDSGDSISVISRNFANLSKIKIQDVTNNLQLFNTSGQKMTVDGVISAVVHLTNGQVTWMGNVVVSLDLLTKEFLLCMADMVKLQILPSDWPFEKHDKGLFDVENKSWHPISSDHNSVSFFKSVKMLHNVNIGQGTATQPQGKYLYKPCLGYMSKF